MRFVPLQIFALSLFLGCSGNGPTGGSGGANTGSGGTWAGTGGGDPGGTGATASGGAFGSGSAAGTGSGGAGTGGGGFVPSNCTEANLEICGNQIGTHCDYTYEYWKDAGDGCLVNTPDGFSVEWTGVSNLLGRKGVRPGTAQNVITYEADYQPDGNSYLCAYGWTKSPLVEYYIVDSWGDWRPPGGEGFQGTMQSDGGTYDIYRTLRENQPSIEGTATFPQFWSVRQERRESGTITVANHFAAWAAHDMDMGNLYEVSMCVEGYMSNGSADVKVSIQ